MSDKTCPVCGMLRHSPECCAGPKPLPSELAPARGSAIQSKVPVNVWGGWTVDFDFLQEVCKECQMEDEGCSLETVEAVILALAKRHQVVLALENESPNN